GYTTHIIGYYSILSPKAQTLQRLFAQNSRFSQNVCPVGRPLCYTCIQKGPRPTAEGFCTQYRKLFLWQHRIIPALRLKHRSGGCGTSLAVSALRIMRYCPILFCFPLREDDFVDKEEDQHQNVTVEHRGSDVIDKVRHQQARNRRSHAVDEVNEAGDQTECQHQAICLARSTLPRNTKLRWIRYRIFIQSRENGRVRAQNGSCNLACLDHASNVHQQL
ncbi:MAG: hypothetical protein WA039_04205, partial [Gemmiger qucibialis]